MLVMGGCCDRFPLGGRMVITHRAEARLTAVVQGIEPIRVNDTALRYVNIIPNPAEERCPGLSSMVPLISAE